MSEGKVKEGQTWIPFSASLHTFREVCTTVSVCVQRDGKGGWCAFTRPNVWPGERGRTSPRPPSDLWESHAAVVIPPPAAASDPSADDVSGRRSHRQTAAENFLRPSMSSESKRSLQGALRQVRNQKITAVTSWKTLTVNWTVVNYGPKQGFCKLQMC